MGGPPIHFQIVDPEAIPRGGCATLVWGLPPDIQGDWPMFLDGRQVERMGEMRVCPEETTTYHLSVETPEGPRMFELTLHVAGEPGPMPKEPGPMPEKPEPMPKEPGPMPEKPGPMGEEPGPEQWKDEAGMMEFPIFFSANPDAIAQGQCTMLHWEMRAGDWKVVVDGRPASFTGDMEVCPDGTRAYELLVESPAGPKTAVVTIQVAAQGQPPEPQPQPQPQPQPGGGLQVDVQPTDLYPDNQPQGVMWARITNNGPGTLANNKVEVSGTAQTTPTSGGGSSPLSFGPQEFTLNLPPGQTQTINLGWPINTTGKRYDFNVLVKVKDFTDPNPSNNGYSETILASTAPGGPGPQPTTQPQPGGKSGADVRVTDLFPKNQPQGKVWTRITNDGPDTLTNAQVELKCGGSGVDANGKTGWSHVESPKAKTITLNPGQTVEMETDISVDTSLYSYELWCSVWPKSFNDPNQNNNKYTEKISAKGGPQPPAPPGSSSWGATKADLAITDLFPQSQPKGAVMLRLTNNGPQAVNSVDVETTCVAKLNAWTQGAQGQTAQKDFKISVGQLNAGQTSEHYTGIDVDTKQYWYDITCTVKPPFNDSNSGNNTYKETIPPPP